MRPVLPLSADKQVEDTKHLSANKGPEVVVVETMDAVDVVDVGDDVDAVAAGVRVTVEGLVTLDAGVAGAEEALVLERSLQESFPVLLEA